LKYLSGLVQAIERLGGRVLTGAKAVNFDPGAKPLVHTERHGTVSADALVVTTNTPANDRVAMHTKQAPYRTYAIGAEVPVESVPFALYWDTEDPFHYVRLQRISEGGSLRDILIVGGEDHKTGQDAGIHDRYARLEAWARERFPQITSVPFQWSGQVLESMDGLGYIGRNPGDHNVYISTGDCGNGMTHGTIAGMLLRDLIMGRENAWATPYDPSRKTLRAASTFARENLNVAAEYGRWVTPGEVGSPEEIKPGEGAILRRGLSKIAVSRDLDGAFHELSAVCTHLGCIVSWNGAEKSWDCPCHGSRFATDGKVMNGPAVAPLAPTSEDA
jgi:Rieske Fe-S protein